MEIVSHEPSDAWKRSLSELQSLLWLLSRRARRRLDAWDCDEEAEEAFEQIRELWEKEGRLLPSYNEDELIDTWIAEVVDIPGHGTSSEVTLPDGGGYVDRLLFENDDARREGAKRALDGDHEGLFSRASAILEAKQWDADFEQRFAEQRSYRDASHQIKYYLERTPGDLKWGVLTDEQLYQIADAAAGDARLAIGMLRSAASTADRENREAITNELLLDAAEDARAQIKQKSLDSLTPHQRVVYDIVRDHGPLGPSEIHDRYTEAVGDPRTKRTVRTYLSKMAQYNLLEAKGTSRDREYSLVDSAAASSVS